MLNGNDIRNSVATLETTTTTTTTKMLSVHNLRTQPPHQTPSNHKESNAASSSSSATKTVFQCLACQKEFVTEKYLCMHMSLHRSAQGIAAAAAGTVIASSPSASIVSGGAKLTTDAKTVIQMTPSSSSPSDGSIKLVKTDGTGASHWSCKICSKTFAQSSNYKNHIRTHSDERPFICNICSIGFKERYHLKKHILFKHSDELKEECRVCGKRFKDSTAVRAHERIHSEDRPYGCQRCEKTFKTSECLWHHENRSRTCGKLLRAAAAAGGGGGLADSSETNPGPRFRRGRHPSKRLALSKAKAAAVAAAAAASTEGDGPMMADASSSVGLTLDHVEEISPSVKIELEREIPDYYFRAVPDFCSYDFDSMTTEVLASDKGSMLTNGGLHSVRSTADAGPLALRAIDPPDAAVNPRHSSLNAVVTTKSPLDQFAAASYWGDWSSSAGAGVLLGSPSRPVSASYDLIGDTYCPPPEAAGDNSSWKQDSASSSAGIYVHGEMTTTTSKPDFVKSQNLARYPQQRNVRQLQQQMVGVAASSLAEVVSTSATTDPSSLRHFGNLVSHPAGDAKTDLVQRRGFGGPSPAHTQVQQQQQLTPTYSYAGDYRPTADKASQSMMVALACMTDTPQWPVNSNNTFTADPGSSSSSLVRIFDGRIPEVSSPIAVGSYPASIAGVPTAVVAPFKRENTSRPLEVNISEAEQQPVKNSLPPFETFAPMTLRVQKSRHAASKAAAQRTAPPADVRFLPSFANPYSLDSSVADQCPTIQKYLLKGHPNASIKISHSLLLPPGVQQQGQGLCHVPFNRQYYRLSPRDNGRHPEGVPSGLLVPFDVGGGGGGGGRQHQAPEFRAAFLSETRRMGPGGGAAAAGGQLGGLVSSSSSSSPLPARVSDATGAVNFVQMMTPPPLPSMLSTSQSAMLQRLNGGSSSSNIADATNAPMSVDVYQQI